MFLNLALSKATLVAKAIGVTLICIAVIAFSSECSAYVAESIKMCLSVLIPSLFPFMAISSFIVNSGISEVSGKPLKWITKTLFGLQPCFAPVILLSMLGGYPVGARGIANIYKKQIANSDECKKCAFFSVCAGPGFMINYVGASLYKNKLLGLIMLASQMISVIFLGIILKFAYKTKSNNNSNTEIKNKSESVGNAIVDSVADSSRGMLAICGFVVLFSAFAGIINALLPESDLKNYTFVLLEVCTAVKSLHTSYPVELIAFATGFGGICIHFQIFSTLGNIGIPKLLFFCARIIQGFLTALLTHFGMMLFLKEQAVFSTDVVQKTDFFDGKIVSGIVLLGIAICFLYSIKNYKTETD